MFFNSQPHELEASVQKWLEAWDEPMQEIIGVSQCECTDARTNERGVLVTLLYRAKHSKEKGV